MSWPWIVLLALAVALVVAAEWERVGGIVGSAVLRGVPEEVRAVLLAGSVVHVGKACVFGHCAFDLVELRGGSLNP